MMIVADMESYVIFDRLLRGLELPIERKSLFSTTKINEILATNAMFNAGASKLVFA